MEVDALTRERNKRKKSTGKRSADPGHMKYTFSGRVQTLWEEQSQSRGLRQAVEGSGRRHWQVQIHLGIPQRRTQQGTHVAAAQPRTSARSMRACGSFRWKAAMETETEKNWNANWQVDSEWENEWMT